MQLRHEVLAAAVAGAAGGEDAASVPGAEVDRSARLLHERAGERVPVSLVAEIVRVAHVEALHLNALQRRPEHDVLVEVDARAAGVGADARAAGVVALDVVDHIVLHGRVVRFA